MIGSMLLIIIQNFLKIMYKNCIEKNNNQLSLIIKNMKNQLSIIIPTKLAHNHIKDCISGLKRHTAINNYEIIFIVNKDSAGITKKSEVNKLSKSKDRKVKVHWAKKDLGIAGAINKGIKLASGKYIFITNDDIEIKENHWFLKYKNVFDKYPCIGSIGLKGNTTGFKSSGIPLFINGYKELLELIKNIKPYSNCQKIKKVPKIMPFITKGIGLIFQKFFLIIPALFLQKNHLLLKSASLMNIIGHMEAKICFLD